MRYILFVVVITLASCTTDFKKFQTPDNAAMPSASLLLYKDIPDIANGNHRILSSEKVYVTGDTAVVNNILYAKVTWGDSVGYVQSNMLVRKGRRAVITSPGHGIVELYSNAGLDEVVENINSDWDLRIVGEPNNTSVPVFYFNSETGPILLYVPKAIVFDDSLDVAFYRAYSNGERTENPDFQKLDLYQWRASAASIDEDFNDTDYGDPGNGETYTEYELVIKERNWSNGDDPIPEDQYPGEIKKYLIFEDDTEMDAEGYSITNGHAYGPSDPGNKAVKAVRFEVTLNRPMDLRFEVESYYSDESGYNTYFTKIFNGAEANKPYSVIIGDTPQNTMILCSVMRATIFAGDVTAAATVAGECGD